MNVVIIPVILQTTSGKNPSEVSSANVESMPTETAMAVVGSYIDRAHYKHLRKKNDVKVVSV